MTYTPARWAIHRDRYGWHAVTPEGITHRFDTWGDAYRYATRKVGR